MDALKDPGTTHFSQLDIKRRTHGMETKDGGINVTTETHTDVTDPLSDSSIQHSVQRGLDSKGLARWKDRLKCLAGLEARRISRLVPDEKHAEGIWQNL